MNQEQKIALLKSMVADVTTYMNREILALEKSSDAYLLEHFGNKMLKIVREASEFEDGDTIDIEQLHPKVEKMNLEYSRCPPILEK